MSATTPDTTEAEEPPADEAADSEAVDVTVEEDEELEPVDLDLNPPRSGQAIALIAGFVGVALTAPFTVLALPFGLAGLALVGLSVSYSPSKGWASLGTALMLIAALISGAFGVVPPAVLLLGIAAIFVSWDASQHAVSLGNQVGRQTRTRRNQMVHSAGTILGLSIASGVLFGVYAIAGDNHPGPAVALIIIGIVLAAWLLRK